MHTENLNTPVAAFINRIQRMNEVFDIERNGSPTYLGADRLRKFRKTIADEIVELNDIVEQALVGEHGATLEPAVANLAVMVALADFLGDVVVYAFSEARRWGIPLDQVLHAIMDSQDSKLVDGVALKDANNKFLKGHNYQPPEPAIQKILEALLPACVTVRRAEQESATVVPTLPELPATLPPVSFGRRVLTGQAALNRAIELDQQEVAIASVRAAGGGTQQSLDMRATIPRFRAGPQNGEMIYSGHLIDALVPMVQPTTPLQQRLQAAAILDAEVRNEHGNAAVGAVIADSMRMTQPGDVGPRGVVFRCS